MCRLMNQIEKTQELYFVSAVVLVFIHSFLITIYIFFFKVTAGCFAWVKDVDVLNQFVGMNVLCETLEFMKRLLIDKCKKR